MPAIRKNRSVERPYTADEDAQLACLVAMHGLRWSRIAAYLPDRTDSSLRSRWKRIVCPTSPRACRKSPSDPPAGETPETLHASAQLAAMVCQALARLDAPSEDAPDLASDLGFNLEAGPAPAVMEVGELEW